MTRDRHRPEGWAELERHYRAQVSAPFDGGQVDRMPAIEDALTAARHYSETLTVLGWDWPGWLDGFTLAVLYLDRG